MEFFVTEQATGTIAEKELLNPAYRSYLVNGATSGLALFAGGRMLSQVLEGSGFRIWFHDFFIEQPASVFAFSKYPLSVLHYALAGDISLRTAKEASLLQEGKYYLLKAPLNTKQAFVLQPGIARLFQIDFPAAFPDSRSGNGITGITLPFGLERINNVVSCGLNDYQVITTIGRIRESRISGRIEQDFFLIGRIMDLLQLQVHHMAEKSRSSAYAPDQKMEAIQDYILTHLEEPLSISGLCQQFHITKSVLQKYFKQYVKQPLHAYIRKQRMEYGLFLLQCGEKQVSEIALLTGYQDISGFRRAFKAYFGFSPSHVASNRDINEWP